MVVAINSRWRFNHGLYPEESEYYNQQDYEYKNAIDEYREHEERIHRNAYNILCPICFVDISRQQQSELLPCCHLFHKKCIKTWMEKSHTCPMCRIRI